MHIIGTGFMAHHLSPLRDRHPGVTVLAAGVPRHPLPESEHLREAELVSATSRDCRARGRLLVFLSTVSMYGSPSCRGLEDETVVPSTRYGAHKLRLEGQIQESGTRHLILRLAYVLGPNGPSFRLVPALVSQIRQGRVRLYRGARRDIMYVSDFVRLLDLLLTRGVADEIVNVASGDCADIADMVEHLEARLGVTVDREFVADAAVGYCASVGKLRRLVPESRAMGFGEGYHRRAIDQYLREEQIIPALEEAR